MNLQPELRIGDAERAAAADALGEHYAAGRLTHEEYDERAGLAWAARTNSDLHPLFVDLPAPRGPVAPRPLPMHGSTRTRGGRVAGARARPAGGWGIPWLPLLIVLAGLALLASFPWWVPLLVCYLVLRHRQRG